MTQDVRDVLRRRYPQNARLDRAEAEAEVRRELATSRIGRYVALEVERQLAELRSDPRTHFRFISRGAMKVLTMSSLCYLRSVYMRAADLVVACERVTLLPAYVRMAERRIAELEQTERARLAKKQGRRLAKKLVEDLGRWEDDGGPCR